MKKIVLLSPAHPLRGGIASSSERLALELQRSGHEVKIVTYRLQYPSILFPGKTQYTDDPPPPGLTIERRLNSIDPLNWWLLGRRLRREQPDLLLIRYWLPFLAPCLGTVARQVRRNGHTKIICIPDNIIPHEKRPGDRRLTQYLVDAVDGFIVMSRSVGEQLQTFTQTAPWAYVPHPIYDNYGEKASRDEALRRLELDPAFRYVLFFGFIRDYKGLDLLLRAMADERVARLPVRLLVAGEFYGNEEKYRKLIAELGLGDRLQLFDRYVSNEEVRYFFGAADLVVQPYRSATQSGISQIAYHFGKPMIVTRVGGLPEIVEHGVAGYVVDVSEKAIVDAMVDFFAHNRRETMEAGVEANKALFSWEHLVRQIESMLVKL
ncbi:MAG: glycosyltransferase [Saprospiraceae bacterium]|nr:glycosyltransferase [Saprospiraceae bacterium]MCB0623904.1 glycosyltransferase [Saprospiraceae bacterium]